MSKTQGPAFAKVTGRFCVVAYGGAYHSVHETAATARDEVRRLNESAKAWHAIQCKPCPAQQFLGEAKTRPARVQPSFPVTTSSQIATQFGLATTETAALKAQYGPGSKKDSKA